VDTTPDFMTTLVFTDVGTRPATTRSWYTCLGASLWPAIVECVAHSSIRPPAMYAVHVSARRQSHFGENAASAVPYHDQQPIVDHYTHRPTQCMQVQHTHHIHHLQLAAHMHASGFTSIPTVNYPPTHWFHSDPCLSIDSFASFGMWCHPGIHRQLLHFPHHEQ